MDMDKLIARINELAHKAKTVGLSSEEESERKQLRQEYLKLFRMQFQQQLDNTYVMDESGEKRKLERKRPN
ncbi:MAG: DUF896 domain-containing protein [Clostridiales bacterium]|nr:DUF896 domain-containing protein [Clostridiales bacterium]MBQ4637951.1 DUF896 domain-containing protein [Clostridia bacterium]